MKFAFKVSIIKRIKPWNFQPTLKLQIQKILKLKGGGIIYVSLLRFRKRGRWWWLSSAKPLEKESETEKTCLLTYTWEMPDGSPEGLHLETRRDSSAIAHHVLVKVLEFLTSCLFSVFSSV